MIVLRTYDDIDCRSAADDLPALRLRHTAGNGDGHAPAGARRRLLEHPHAPELGENLLLRLLANVARIEHDEVRVLDTRRLAKALRRKRVRHTMRIVDVHLASEGLDVNLARCGHAGRSRSPLRCQTVEFIG